MKGRCKTKGDHFWRANFTKRVSLKPTIEKAVLKGMLVVFRSEVVFNYNTLVQNGGEDVSNRQGLEVLIIWQTLLNGGCGEAFEQVRQTDFFRKSVPCVQLAGVLEFTIRLMQS